MAGDVRFGGLARRLESLPLPTRLADEHGVSTLGDPVRYHPSELRAAGWFGPITVARVSEAIRASCGLDWQELHRRLYVPEVPEPEPEPDPWDRLASQLPAELMGAALSELLLPWNVEALADRARLRTVADLVT